MSFFRRLFGKKPKSSQQGNADQLQQVRIEEEHKRSAKKQALPKFEKVNTSDPEEAVNILFDKALAVVPVLYATQFQTAYDRMRQDWGPLPLVEGSKSEVKSVILNNAKALSRRADFKHFSIDVCLSDQGYKGEEAASMWAWVGTIGLALHLWKTEDKFHAFGRPEWLGETSSPRRPQRAESKSVEKSASGKDDNSIIKFESLDSFRELICRKYNLSTHEYTGTIEPETLLGILEQVEESISIYWSIINETVKEIGVGSVFSSQAEVFVFPKGQFGANMSFVGLAKYQSEKHLEYHLRGDRLDKADMGISHHLVFSRFMFNTKWDNAIFEMTREPVSVNELKTLVAEREAELGI